MQVTIGINMDAVIRFLHAIRPADFFFAFMAKNQQIVFCAGLMAKNAASGRAGAGKRNTTFNKRKSVLERTIEKDVS